MLKVCFVASVIDHPIPNDFDVYVGVDKGALACLNQGISLTMAIGDFDSVTPKEKARIKQHANQFIELPAIKDQSDFEAAILQWSDKADVMVLVGGLGHRLDHQYANIELMKQHSNLQLLNQTNHLMIASTSLDIPKEQYKFLSLFALETSLISITGVKYPLDHRRIHPHDVFALSNEIVQRSATLTIHQGRILIIRSNDA